MYSLTMKAVMGYHCVDGNAEDGPSGNADGRGGHSGRGNERG